uniref:Uncharacterized protein n=1 Tax=Pararge aegeria TaxID=116150 RepID=S4PY33_9NEOP
MIKSSRRIIESQVVLCSSVKEKFTTGLQHADFNVNVPSTHQFTLGEDKMPPYCPGVCRSLGYKKESHALHCQHSCAVFAARCLRHSRVYNIYHC